jgi:hypothetical protein
MDRDELDRGGITVETAGALGGRGRLSALAAEPLQQRRQPEPLAVGDVVEHLTQMMQVGEKPLAVRAGQDALGEAAGSDRLVDRGDATGSEEVEPAADLFGDRVGQLVAAAVE